MADFDIAIIGGGINGAGIIQAPLFMLLPHLEAGELKEILTPWKGRSMRRGEMVSTKWREFSCGRSS